jgi:hypothetical protein
MWRRLKASRLEILLAFASLAISLFAAEWFCRQFIFDPTAAYIRTPGWSMAVRLNDLAPRVHEDHVIYTNYLGIRGASPSLLSSPHIAVLGGSTVEDLALPEQQTWAQQLEHDLQPCAPNVWVGNFGKAGINARHHLIQFPEVVKYAPHIDTFVVLLGLNDFLFDLHIHHPFVTPEGWWRRQALMYDHGDEGNLALLALGGRLYRNWSRPNEPGLSQDFGYYQKGLRDDYAKVTYRQWVRELPDLSSHLDTYRKTIAQLRELANAYGSQIVFVTQPFIWSDRMSEAARQQIYAGFIGPDPQSPETKWYTTEALRVGLSAYNATLLDTCRSDGLSCVDAARLFEGHEDYFYDDFHFSPEGAAAIGALVADDIKKHLPGCSSPSSPE